MNIQSKLELRDAISGWIKLGLASVVSHVFDLYSHINRTERLIHICWFRLLKSFCPQKLRIHQTTHTDRKKEIQPHSLQVKLYKCEILVIQPH